MNFKNTSRALCLFLVLCMLVGMSPIQAEATGITAAISGVIATNPIATLGAIVVALGVVCIAEKQGRFDQLISDCETWIRDTTNYITDEGLHLAQYTYNGLSQLFVPEGLVQAVRDFLFSSGALETVTALSGATISCSSVNGATTSGLRFSVRRLFSSSPENLMAAFKNLGVNTNVFILGQTASVLHGIYFNSDGALTYGGFINPLGIVHATLFGTFPISSLQLYDGFEHEVCGGYNVSSMSTSYDSIPFYYNVDYARASAGFLTSNVRAFFWDDVPVVKSTLTNTEYLAFPVYSKASSSTDFGTSVGYVVPDFMAKPVSVAYPNQFTWDTSTYETVIGDADLKLENVALPDKSIADGYAYWNAGAISLPDSVNIPNQEEERKYLPIVPMDKMEDIYDLTQDEAQTNTATGNPTVDTETDRVTFTSLKELLESIRDHFSNWFARISLNVSNIMQYVRDGFASLIAAVANIPNLIAGLFRFLAEQLRGLGFIWELLQMIGEYLGSIFSWMPETMRAIVMVTFTIAGLYMLIGR